MSSDSEVDQTEIEQEIENNNPDDVLKILITTDNHLGFMEKDPERGEDSYIAFEEALQIAEREQVDFILLGGDLFHENKPSRDCLAKCQSLLRKYCFGIKPIDFSIISDEHVNFGHTNFPFANFNDPNLNVSIPVFSIHGNHDDPTGAQNLCALDILASAGLINYFGKSNTNMQSDIQINPVLIEKGETKLAIFGLGAVKDERLHHLFEKGMVKVNRPTEDTEDYFNMFVIHQNRTAHGKKNYIPEHFLEDFLDLVLWGHEHENRLRPEYNELKEFYVTQPGSTVITALCESEADPKAVGLLKINKKNFTLKAIELTTTRPFLIDNMTLKSSGLLKTDKNLEQKIEQVCAKKVNEMILEANKSQADREKPLKPLIRLKVDYTDYDLINEARFAQKFVDKVANPRSILQFYRKQNTDKVDVTLDPEASKFLGAKYLEHIRVEDLVMKYFKEADEKNQLLCLTERGLSDAIKEYIEKDEKDAILELVNFQVKKTQTYLKANTNLNENQIDDEIKKFRRMRIAAEKEEEGEIKEIFNKVSQKSIKNSTTQNFDGSDDEDTNDAKPSLFKPKSSKTAAAAKKKNLNSDDDDDDFGYKKPEIKAEKLDFDDDETPIPTTLPARGKGSRGGRGSRGGGRGRGAKTAATATVSKNQTQLDFLPKQEPISQQHRKSPRKATQTASRVVEDTDDSDIELLTSSYNNKTTIKQEPLSTRQSNVTTQKATTQSTQQQRTQSARNTNKIKYDDSEEEQSQQVTFNMRTPGSKSKKPIENATAKADYDNDDDDDIDIFKRMQNTKRRKC